MASALTIPKPKSPEELRRLVQLLEENEFVSPEQAAELVAEVTTAPNGKSRWAEVAEHFTKTSNLRGCSAEMERISREFKGSFVF